MFIPLLHGVGLLFLREHDTLYPGHQGINVAFVNPLIVCFPLLVLFSSLSLSGCLLYTSDAADEMD